MTTGWFWLWANRPPPKLGLNSEFTGNAHLLANLRCPRLLLSLSLATTPLWASNLPKEGRTGCQAGRGMVPVSRAKPSRSEWAASRSSAPLNGLQVLLFPTRRRPPPRSILTVSAVGARHRRPRHGTCWSTCSQGDAAANDIPVRWPGAVVRMNGTTSGRPHQPATAASMPMPTRSPS